MASRHTAAFVESLETRAYASVSRSTSYAADDPKPSTVIEAYPRGDKRVTDGRVALDRVAVYTDADGVLRVNGTHGDDRVSVTAMSKGRVRIDTITRETYSFYKRPDDQAPMVLTATLTDRHVLTGVSSILIDGDRGRDTLQIKGLQFNPPAYDMERAAVDTPEAPAGATPSDPIRTGRYKPGGGWDQQARAEKKLADRIAAATGVQSGHRTAFFGDSHAVRFKSYTGGAWDKLFGGTQALGIAGDTTRQMLTRIEDGLFEHYQPSVVVLSAGTNNFNDPTTGGTDAQIYRGILTVIGAIRDAAPDTRVVLLGLLPQAGAGLNDRIKDVNARLAEAAETEPFEFLNVYDRFANSPKGAVALLGASSHYTKRGYGVIAYALNDLLNGRTP